MELCSEATKTVAILLTVKPSVKLCDSKTPVFGYSKTPVFGYLYAESLGFTEVHFHMATARLN